MDTDPRIALVTERIERRSAVRRRSYLEKIKRARNAGPSRRHLSCGNQAHAFAATGADKSALARRDAPNLAIVTAYNDVLSAHQPFREFPEIIKAAARDCGATAQVAGGVPAMCDGVTQGQSGMELSLFSRDVIALSASVALSHDIFDAAIFLGVCDKIVPGLVIAAATFGHLPAVFAPAGPMLSGLANDRKADIRRRFAAGEVSRDVLMKAEMASYHGPGTCTFYGTANSNQMLMEFMGLHLPGTSFVNPGTELRRKLTEAATRRAREITALGNEYLPVGHVLCTKTFVNGIVGLMATGGSTNLVIHMIAMARAAGIILEIEDFADISATVPLLARVYPNGLADVNHFHAAGGLGFVFRELLDSGLLHADAPAIGGKSIASYCREPVIRDGQMTWDDAASDSGNLSILRPVADPFSCTGGLKCLDGNLGRAIMKVSAVEPGHRCVKAPAAVFHDQNDVLAAFREGQLDRDVVVVVRFQGPRSNGMPELHALTPALSSLQSRGFKVALVTDGRMSGASGKVPSAIHVSPEASRGGAIGKLTDGDMILVDPEAGRLESLDPDFETRSPVPVPDMGSEGCGRELFSRFRELAGDASHGASILADS